MQRHFSSKTICSTLVTLVALVGLILATPGAGWGKGNTPINPKNTFNIMMNYELGMHCTGFEFSYCCVLPPYNSILAQVVKTQQDSSPLFPTLMQADPNVGLDFLGRPTVLRDTETDSSGHFKKYVLRYWHDAQPRNDGRGAPQTSTLISSVEGNSLLMWNTQFDAATTDSNNKLIYGDYGEVAAAVNTGPLLGQHQASSAKHNVMLGNGTYSDPEDNYANAWLNHFYIYSDLEGGNPANTSLDKNKIYLGSRNLNSNVQFSTVLPQNSGPAFHPLGPGSTPGLNNVLTFSGDKGTVVFTQMKVLENLPIMLTSPRIWEALGLPLDPFEDTINFFGDPGKITESTLRPYVKMNAALHNYDPSQPGGIGTAVLQNGNPVVGFGTAPIDIPNCSNCHALAGSVAAVNNPNNPANFPTDAYRPATAAKVQLEYEFWNDYYFIDVMAGDSDWYSQLKAAAISILSIHDNEHRTDFTLHYPVTGGNPPQLTRLGHQSVICQRCHADNVIAVVKSATGRGLIPPLTEAIHNNHADVVSFNDSKGRNGSCQGCHPAHRSDGSLDHYPITATGDNFFASTDNRDAAGGCFVGRDVHSNPGRSVDLTGKTHLNAVGSWLQDNVANDTGHDKGIWCTNCHSQFSQELWRAENVKDLVHSQPGDPGNVRWPKNNAKLADVAAAAGVSLSQAIAWLDPKNSTDDTFAVWNDAVDYPDANVATIEILSNGTPAGTTDADGDFSVRILDFCTTPDCVAAAQTVLNGEGNGSTAVPVPFQAADDARDHWLAPGEPHCADCHQAPYVEQSGNINAFPPFNYPRKASLFRYSRGHQDITCQGCHESTHGLYPVTPTIDTTTYAQSASMNTNGKHGPLTCGACHQVNNQGVPTEIKGITYNGNNIDSNLDDATSWMHAFTDETSPTDSLCRNCHNDRSGKVACDNDAWIQHTMAGRIAREQMDKVENKMLGAVCGTTDPLNTVCLVCHGNRSSRVRCSTGWISHLQEGRVSQSVWEAVTTMKTGGTCGF